MKVLLKIIIFFGLVININAQSIGMNSLIIRVNGNTKSTIKLDKKLLITKGLQLEVSPQFGNLFMTRIEAKKAKINLNDFYDDFDLGINIGFNYSLMKQLCLKAFYNMGMLKIDEPDNLKDQGYDVQLSIDYVF